MCLNLHRTCSNEILLLGAFYSPTQATFGYKDEGVSQATTRVSPKGEPFPFMTWSIPSQVYILLECIVSPDCNHCGVMVGYPFRALCLTSRARIAAVNAKVKVGQARWDTELAKVMSLSREPEWIEDSAFR